MRPDCAGTAEVIVWELGLLMACPGLLRRVTSCLAYRGINCLAVIARILEDQGFQNQWQLP